MWLTSGIAVAVVSVGSYSSDSTPSLGTSICHRGGSKKKKKEKKRKCIYSSSIDWSARGGGGGNMWFFTDIAVIVPVLSNQEMIVFVHNFQVLILR